MTRGGLETVSTESGTEGSNPALSSGESRANRRARGETLRHKVNEDGATLSRTPSDSPSPPRPSRRTAAEGFLKFRTRLLTLG